MKVRLLFLRSLRPRFDRATLLLIFFAVVVILSPHNVIGQHSAAPKLKLAEIEQLVTHHAPDSLLAAQIQRLGLDFAPNSTIVESLRAKGAGPNTISAIRALFPRSEVYLIRSVSHLTHLGLTQGVQAQFEVHLFKQDGWFDTGIPITDELYIGLFPPSFTRRVQVMIGKTVIDPPPTDQKNLQIYLVSKSNNDEPQNGKRWGNNVKDVLIPEKSTFYPLKVRVLPSEGAPDEGVFRILVTVLKKDPEGQGEFSTVQQNEEQALMEHEANSPIRASQLPAPAAKTKAPATQIPAQTVHTTDEVWIDPATGLMWTGKDNGSDMNWQQAMDYCQSLQLAGYSDWRLPTIDELQGIYDQNINLPGQCCGGNQVTFHVKGNLQLSGWHWSSSPGDASGTAWYFPFNKMIGRGSSRLVNRNNWRALCVRRSGTAVDRSVPTEPPPPPRAPVPAKRPTPRPSGLDGDWRNVDPNTRSIVEIIIAGKDIHPYGACRPNACDMGVITAESFASSTQSSDISKLVAKKNQGFSQIEISLSLEPDGRLRAEKFTHFTDGSGRADYSSVDYFNRSGPLNNP